MLMLKNIVIHAQVICRIAQYVVMVVYAWDASLRGVLKVTLLDVYVVMDIT